MILDNLDESEKYTKLHPLFEQAFAFLKQTHFENLPDGKHEIAGQDLFVLISRNGTTEAEDPKLEVHRKYLDIHYAVNGSDEIGWKFLGDCKEPIDTFKIEDDYQLFRDKNYTSIIISENKFLIVYPGDAHSPLIRTKDLFKAVLKIKL